MPAAFDVALDIGGADNAPGSTVVVTNLRFNNEDTNDQDLLSPVTIPGAGTAWSFWKQIYLKCTTAPATQVDNVKIYTDGALGWGAGVTVYVGDELPVKNSGSSAGYDVATVGEDIVNHTDVITKTSLFTFTSAAPKSLTISEAGAIINATLETCNYIVLATEVGTTGTSGLKTAETATYSYDEI